MSRMGTLRLLIDENEIVGHGKVVNENTISLADGLYKGVELLGTQRTLVVESATPLPAAQSGVFALNRQNGRLTIADVLWFKSR